MAKCRELFARAQPQLMIEQMREFQIEAVLQIRTDVTRQAISACIARRTARCTARCIRAFIAADARVQIAFDGQLPMQPPAPERFDEKIALAERHARAPQRDVGSDEPRGGPLLQKPREQAFGIPAEPRHMRRRDMTMQRSRIGVLCFEPVQRRGGFVGRFERLREHAERRLRAQQIGTEQQPRDVAHGGIGERVEPGRRWRLE